jgi:hypothetical protein
MICGTSRPRLARLVGTVAQPVQGWIAELSREAITHSLMVLSLPGRLLALGANLADPYPSDLVSLVNSDLVALVGEYEPASCVNCGARDWSSLEQRMHYIVHLFRAFHETANLGSPPFTEAEISAFSAGRIPDGDL